MRYSFLARFVLGVQVCLACAYGFGEHISTLQATFTQRTASQDNTLVYSGTLYAKAPAKAKWIYENPTQKEIYISDGRAIVYEPMLEQAHITKAKIDFLDILRHAKKQSNGVYVADFEKTQYTLFVENDKPKKLVFIDELDNTIEITFHKVKLNVPINDAEFTFIPPVHIDIIEENTTR